MSIIGKPSAAIFVILCATACLNTGCNGEKPRNPKSTNARSASALPPVPASFGKQPTDEQCLDIARSIEQAIDNRDVAAANKLFAWEALLEEATGGFDDSVELRKATESFGKGFKEGVVGSHGLFGAIADSVEKGSTYSYLKTHTAGGQKRVLFRLILANGGINYHDFVVAVMPGDELKIRDVYVFLTGEMISELCRRSFLPVAQQASRGLLDRLTGRENEFMQNAPRLNLMREQLRNEHFSQLLATYDSLPESLKRDKTVLLLRLQAAQGIDDNEYLAAIADIQKYHPDDRSIHMIAIDGFLLNGQYEKALESIDKLDRAIDGDPYLDVMRARVFLEQSKFETARKLAEKALAADETLLDAYWVLVTSALAAEDFDKTVALLNTMDEKFDMEFFDLETMPEYAEFVKSPQYDEWKRARGEKDVGETQ